MLPGFGVALAPAIFRERRLHTVEVVSYQSISSTSITIPNTVRPGDLLFGVDYAVNAVGSGSAPSPVDWSGFTLVRGLTIQGLRRIRVYRSIATSGDAGRTVSGMSGSSTNVKRLLVLRFNHPIRSLNEYHWADVEWTNGDPPPRIVETSPKTPSLTIAFFASDSSFSSFTFSPEGQSTPSGSGIFAWKLFAENPENVTIDKGDSGQFNWFWGANYELGF